MRAGQATISAVLSTLLRATADHRAPVILRRARAGQAGELARWLEQAHGSPRRVIASATCGGDIVVRLPVRMTWPSPAAVSPPAAAPLAAAHLPRQLSRMSTPPSSTGRS